MSFSVGIYLFDAVESLDVTGPMAVFTAATRANARKNPGQPAMFEVFTISAEPEAVRTRDGLRIQAHHTFADHPPMDCLIVPGGVVSGEQNKPEVVTWINAQALTLPSKNVSLAEV